MMCSIFGDRDPRGRNSTAADGLYSVYPQRRWIPGRSPHQICLLFLGEYVRPLWVASRWNFGGTSSPVLASTDDAALRLGPAWSGVECLALHRFGLVLARGGRRRSIMEESDVISGFTHSFTSISSSPVC